MSTDLDVLIVDDDDATRNGLSELLAYAGVSVDMASDGAEALEKIDRDNFRVVLLDVQLPGLGGLDVLRRCAAKHIAAKIIIMTGADTRGTVLEALRGHAYDFISKPIEPRRLIEVVRRALVTGPETPSIEILSAQPEWLELLVPCTRESVDRIQSFVERLEMDLADKVRESVGLAFRELLLNGVEWGGQLNPTQKVRVACLRTRRMLLYRIADPGPGFKLDELSHASTSERDAISHDAVRQQKGIRPGGFGLVLIRAIADELIYNERRNEVLFIKYLDKPDGPAADA